MTAALSAAPAAPEMIRRFRRKLLVFVPKQFKLLFTFVLGDFFTPFLFQVTHFEPL